jgi:hypothetical protein
MTSDDSKLIKDLARLASRYGPEDFATLGRLIREGSLESLLIKALEDLATASASSNARKPPSKTIVAKLNALRDTDPRRAELLSDLRSRLQAGEVLPTLASLRAFGEMLGMKELQATRREKAVPIILEHLLALPDRDFEAALEQAANQPDRQLGDEYDRWVSLILRRNPGSEVTKAADVSDAPSTGIDTRTDALDS